MPHDLRKPWEGEVAGWRGEREREGGRGRGVSEFVFFFLLLRARGGTPFLFLPRWFPSLGPHLSHPLHGAHGVRRAGRGGGVPARGGGGGECRGRERTPACAAAQHSTRTRGSLFFFRGGTGREGEGPGGCANHTRRCGRACACGGERDKERKKQASGSQPRPRSLPPAVLLLAHKQVFFPTHPPPFSAPHTPPWVTSRSSSPPRTTPGTRCVRMGCWAAGAGGARGAREGEGEERSSIDQEAMGGGGGPPRKARVPRPRPPPATSRPGGGGRAWLPAGRVAPAKTVRAAAADGVLWGQARPPPRPRARDAPLVSTKDGGARALVVTPAPWKGPNVGLGPSILAVGWRFARGRAPPSRRQARRPPPIAGGRGAAAGGASRLLFPLPALTHHHPTAPHSLSQVKYRRRREGKTDYRARLRLTTQDKNK